MRRLDPSAVAQALDLLEWERWLAADARGYVFAAPIERDVLLQEMVTPGQASSVPGRCRGLSLPLRPGHPAARAAPQSRNAPT